MRKFKEYLVGGAVRDEILGYSNKDLDYVFVFDYLNKKNYFYSGEKICQMDLNFNVIKVWDNISQIKKETNFNTQTILRNIKGKIKTSNNHIFKIYD